MNIINLTLFTLLLPRKSYHANGQTALVIKAVADWYGIKCIALFRSNYTTLDETEEIFRVLKFTLHNMDMVEMKDLETGTIDYHDNRDRCSKMLYVIDGRSSRLRHKIEELSYSAKLSGPIWLVFLPGTLSPEEYLINTYVPFNADFIVAETREEMVKLKYVYRVSKTHTLRVRPFGYWTEDRSLILDGYSPSWQRTDLEGKVFRVSAIENWPLTVISGTSVDGFFGKVWRDLEERLNFSTIYIEPKDFGIGVWNGKEWNGLMGMMARGEIDAAISEVTMTTGRLDIVDFLIPLFATRYQLFFRPPGLLIEWDLIVRPFTREVWLGLALLFGFTTLLLAACHRIGVYYGLEDAEVKMERQYLFLMVSAFCQQAPEVTPKSICCRFMVATTYLFSSVIVIIYACTLMSMIATRKPVRPFDSLESFLKDGSYTLEQIPGTDSYLYFSNSTDHVLQEIHKNLFSKSPEEELPKSHKSALERVCRNKKIAHFGEFGVAIVSANQLTQNEGCTIAVLQRNLKLLYLTMAVTKGSPYKDALNYQLSHMLNTGILSRLRNMNFPLWGILQKVSVRAIPAEQLAQVNLLLLIAMLVSVSVLAVEFAMSKSNSTGDAD